METPGWLNRANIKQSLDARQLLASGIHPLEQVMQVTSLFETGDVFEILTPFPPFPMIEKMQDAGFESFSEQKDLVFYTYFRKP
ncbi:MAG: hypothetical protein WCO02_16085 [Bacteroidota bacterium]